MRVPSGSSLANKHATRRDSRPADVCSDVHPGAPALAALPKIPGGRRVRADPQRFGEGVTPFFPQQIGVRIERWQRNGGASSSAMRKNGAPGMRGANGPTLAKVTIVNLFYYCDNHNVALGQDGAPVVLFASRNKYFGATAPRCSLSKCIGREIATVWGSPPDRAAVIIGMR
jgi:hypothetical protein